MVMHIDEDNVTCVQSKTLAERAAWKFVSELPAEKRFELATVNPVFVQVILMGPD